MKKVLYITYDGLLDPLGQSQILPYINELCNYYKFSVLSYEKKDKLKSKEYSVLKNKLKKKKIKHYALKFKNKLFIPFQIIKGFFAAIKIIHKDRIDFIHSRSFIASLIALLLKKTFNIPFIFDMRGFWVEERIELGVLKKKIFYKLLKLLERKIMENSNQIVVLTKAMKKELITKYNTKTPISVIPTCVDLKKFKMSKREIKKLKLVYFGSYGRRYNLEGVIDFFEFLTNNTSAELSIVLNNANDLSDSLLEKIENNKNIKLLNSIHRGDIPLILKKHNFSIYFLNVRLSGKGVCPTKFGESLACGLPVITNKGVGDCDELIKKNKLGIILENQKEKTILKALNEIDKLIKDKKLNERCRKFAENYLDIKKGVQNYLEVYLNVAE